MCGTDPRRQETDKHGVEYTSSDGIPVGQSNTSSDPLLALNKRMWPPFSAFMVSMLLAELDQTVVSTALPRISSQFNQLSQSAWVVSAFMMTTVGLMLVQGQLLTLVPGKYVYLGSLFIFLIGSLICAVAPSFPVLIFGRAVAGSGAGGVVNSVLILVTQNSRLEDRTILFSILSTMHALSVIVGPLIGGAFTDDVTWRWCFYLNLPILGVLLVVVHCFLQARPIVSESSERTGRFFWLRKLDWVGGFISLAVVVTVLLPLQWGGVQYAWNSAIIISLFIVSGVLFIIFFAWEYYKGPMALLSLRLFTRRTQIGTTVGSFCIGLGLFNGSYFLPLWYQAQGHGATKSGVDNLPFMLSIVISSVVSGAFITKTRRYWHVLVLSPLLTSIGAGLLTSLTLSTPNSHVIGFQILYGVGVGSVFQNVYIAAQAEWEGDNRMLAQATTLLTFVQIIGGIIGISISETIFTNLLRENLRIYAPQLPDAIAVAVEQSVTAIALVDPSMREFVREAYADSISRVFFMGVPAGALSCLGGLIVRNIPLPDATKQLEQL